MTRQVLIVGQGIAGLTCAKQLARLGWQIEIRGAPVRSAPLLVLNDVTYHLLNHIWQSKQNLFADAMVFTARHVRWGGQGAFAKVEQSHFAIGGDGLAKRLRESLLQDHQDCVRITDDAIERTDPADPQCYAQGAGKNQWVLDATGRTATVARQIGPVVRHSFGQRCISSIVAQTIEDAPQTACWLESVPAGWVFCIPTPTPKHWVVQTMAPTPSSDPTSQMQNILEQTQILRHYIHTIGNAVTLFPAAPQLTDPLCGEGWLAVGDAAFAVDPICGDGTGYGIRGALLAAAVLEGMANGMARHACLSHYTQRLQRAFWHHLRACLHFYTEGFSSTAWQAEIEQMTASAFFTTYQATKPMYRFEDFKLTPLT